MLASKVYKAALLKQQQQQQHTIKLKTSAHPQSLKVTAQDAAAAAEETQWNESSPLEMGDRQLNSSPWGASDTLVDGSEMEMMGDEGSYYHAEDGMHGDYIEVLQQQQNQHQHHGQQQYDDFRGMTLEVGYSILHPHLPFWKSACLILNFFFFFFQSPPAPPPSINFFFFAFPP
jgi:hypothetical protein